MIHPQIIHPSDSFCAITRSANLAADQQPAIQEHLAVCGECALELDRLRVTMAALRILPDCEIPQRIGFVSDKVVRTFGGFAVLCGILEFRGTAGVCLGLCAGQGLCWCLAYHRSTGGPAEVRTVVQASNQDVSESKSMKRLPKPLHRFGRRMRA